MNSFAIKSRGNKWSRISTSRILTISWIAAKSITKTLIWWSGYNLPSFLHNINQNSEYSKYILAEITKLESTILLLLYNIIKTYSHTWQNLSGNSLPILLTMWVEPWAEMRQGKWKICFPSWFTAISLAADDQIKWSKQKPITSWYRETQTIDKKFAPAFS